MKKIFIYVFVAFLAVIMIGISFMNFDPEVEKWSSLLAGALIALTIVKLPAIIAFIKKTKAKSVK